MNKGMLVSFCFILLFLTGCSGLPRVQGFKAKPTSTVLPPIVPMIIECTTAYRSSVFNPIEATKSVTLSAEIGNTEVSFKDLAFHAWYYDGSPYELREVKLWVTTRDSQNEISKILYQLSRSNKLANQIDEHGFTGLNYVYNPISRSELQYWCRAE